MRYLHFKHYILPTIIFYFILGNCAFAQDSRLEVLAPLVGGKWLVETKWSNGQTFKQETIYAWALDRKILKVKTYGTINQETGEYGLRNEGIRAWDAENEKIRFWEFDIYGGITNGECIIDEGVLHFEYPYIINNEVKKMRDSWTPVDADTYKYEVVMKENGEWSKVLISTEIRRITK